MTIKEMVQALYNNILQNPVDYTVTLKSKEFVQIYIAGKYATGDSLTFGLPDTIQSIEILVESLTASDFAYCLWSEGTEFERVVISQDTTISGEYFKENNIDSFEIYLSTPVYESQHGKMANFTLNINY